MRAAGAKVERGGRKLWRTPAMWEHTRTLGHMTPKQRLRSDEAALPAGNEQEVQLIHGASSGPNHEL